MGNVRKLEFLNNYIYTPEKFLLLGNALRKGGRSGGHSLIFPTFLTLPQKPLQLFDYKGKTNVRISFYFSNITAKSLIYIEHFSNISSNLF